MFKYKQTSCMLYFTSTLIINLSWDVCQQILVFSPPPFPHTKVFQKLLNASATYNFTPEMVQEDFVGAGVKFGRLAWHRPPLRENLSSKSFNRFQPNSICDMPKCLRYSGKIGEIKENPTISSFIQTPVHKTSTN